MRCEICSELTIKTFGVFIVNFEHISDLALVSLLLTLTSKMLAGQQLSVNYSKSTIGTLEKDVKCVKSW